MNKDQKKDVIVALREHLAQLEKDEQTTRDKLKMAQLDGDLSENADWKILNEKLENLQRQIFRLKEKLLLAKESSKVEVLITYRILETSEEKEVKLTDEWAIDPAQGKISAASPLGLALLNKQVGEISEVKTNQKIYRIQIINIK